MRSEKQKLAIIFQGLWMILSLPLASSLARALDCYDLLMLLFFYISISCPALINNVWNWYKGSTNEKLPKKIFYYFFAASFISFIGLSVEFNNGDIDGVGDILMVFLPIICFTALVLFNIDCSSFFKKIISRKKFILKLILILAVILGLFLFFQNQHNKKSEILFNINKLLDAKPIIKETPPDDLVPLDQYHDQK